MCVCVCDSGGGGDLHCQYTIIECTCGCVIVYSCSMADSALCCPNRFALSPSISITFHFLFSISHLLTG